MSLEEKVLAIGFEKTITGIDFASYKNFFKGEYNYTAVITIRNEQKGVDFLFHHQNSSGSYLKKNITMTKVKSIIKAIF